MAKRLSVFTSRPVLHINEGVASCQERFYGFLSKTFLVLLLQQCLVIRTKFDLCSSAEMQALRVTPANLVIVLRIVRVVSATCFVFFEGILDVVLVNMIYGRLIKLYGVPTVVWKNMRICMYFVLLLAGSPSYLPHTWPFFRRRHSVKPF